MQIHSTIVNSYQGQISLVKIIHSLSFLFYRIKCVIWQLVKYIVWSENSKGLSLTFTDLGQIQLWKLAIYTSPRKKLDLSKIKLKASISQPPYAKLHYSCRNTPSKDKHGGEKLTWSCTVKELLRVNSIIIQFAGRNYSGTTLTHNGRWYFSYLPLL